METQLVSLEVSPAVNLPVVHVVWVGLKRLRETHRICCICSTEDMAIKRVDGYNSKEEDHYQPFERLEYWYETLLLDHLLGSAWEAQTRSMLRRTRGD